MQYADDSVYDASHFQSAVNALSGERQILSNEWFVGQSAYFNFVNRSMVARRLAEAMPEARILLFIRGQESILKSLYSIALHGDEKRTLDDFVWMGEAATQRSAAVTGAAPAFYNTTGGHEQLEGFDYLPLIKLYKGLFKHVEVVVYEDLVYDPERVITQLERWAEVGLSDELKAQIMNSDKVHRGVGARQARRLRKLNKYQGVRKETSPQSRWLLYRKRKVLKSSSSTSELTFSPAVRNALVKWSEPRNAALARAYPELELHRYAEEYHLND